MNLQINIENLPKKGGQYSFLFNAEDIDVSEVVGEGKLKAHVEKRRNLYKVGGQINFPLKLTCARCLEDFERQMELEFDLEFKKVPNYRIPEEFAEEMEAAEDEEYLVENNLIDLEPVIHDRIILSIPMKPLCDEECKGLCPVCGVNLNKSICEHVKEKDEKTIDVH